MKRIFRTLLLLLLVSACSEESPQLRALDTDAVILAFGDSLTFGEGASQNQSYPAVLSELTGLDVINAGLSGETSEEGLSRLPSVLADNRVDLLILMHGGNDLLRNFPSSRTISNLTKMVELARRNDIDVLLVAIPKPGIFLKPQPLYTEVATQLGLPLESEIITYVEKDNTLKSDSVHPNAKGYRLIAEAIAAKLSETGAID